MYYQLVQDRLILHVSDDLKSLIIWAKQNGYTPAKSEEDEDSDCVIQSVEKVK